MDSKVESFQHNGFTVTIHYDNDAESPRTAYDNLSTLTCSHRRYNLGDASARHHEPLTVKQIVKRARDDGDRVLAILPLYLVDHSGISMSCGAFGDRWDSGQVGWGYVLRSQAEKMGCTGAYGGEGGGTWDRARLEDAIRGEVATYDEFLTGQVYGYVVTDADGDELDSCWGFMGDIAYVRQEAKEAADDCEPLGRVHAACAATCTGGV